jgi:hypothetical protein
MRVSFQLLLRTTFYSCMALLAAAPLARGQAANPPAASAAPTAGGPTTMPAKMIFKKYAISDTQKFQGMVILQGVMPVDWNMKGGMTWRPALGTPDMIRIHWGDAQDICAFDMYPTTKFVWSPNAVRSGRVKIGQVSLGNVVQQTPTDQFDAIDKVIVQYFRPDLAKAKVVDKQKMPDWATKVHDKINTDPTYPIAVGAGSETFEYQLKGQTIQETVSALVTIGSIQDTQWWSVGMASSKRAPKGGFDQIKPIGIVMIQSMQMNPQWNQQVAQFVAQRKQNILNAQQQSIANSTASFNATEQRINDTHAQEDQQNQAFDQHMSNIDRQSDAEADYQREVSPWKASDGSTYKLPTAYSYAWQGADGNVIMNNDAGYNPNQDSSNESTTWTPMQQNGN